MKDLFFSSLSEQIGFTLLHSLWQGIIGVVVILVVSRIVGARYSTLRYWLFVSVMLMVLVANIFTFSNQILEPNINEGTNPDAGFTEILLGAGQLTATTTSVVNYWSSNIQHVLPYIVMLWWMGIIALFIKLTINLWQVRQLTRANHLPVPKEVMDLFERVKERLNINKIVQLVQTKEILVPSVIGHLKPIILLPIGLINGLSNDQVEAILLHELSHIKRHDFLVNIIQSFVEVIYVFNPFMWIISKAIRDEREHACDDTAISLGISSLDYAQTLAGVFNYAIKRQQFVMSFASNNKLTLKRIQRIMKNQSNNNNKLLASMLFVIAITLSMYYGAQSHAPGQDISDMVGDRAVMAMVVPSFNIPKIPVLKDVDKELAFNKFTQAQQLVESDTIDPKELKKRAEAYDKAMEGLKATKEWQEVERLREDMVEQQMLYMKDLRPLMEDAMHLAEERMALEQLDLIDIEEHLARVSEVMKDLQIDVEIERVLELNSKVLEETMQHMEVVMEEMNLAEIEDAVRLYTQEAKVMAIEAKAMALATRRSSDLITHKR